MDTSLRNLDVDLTNNCSKQQCGEDDLFSEIMTVSTPYFIYNKHNNMFVMNYFRALKKLYKC